MPLSPRFTKGNAYLGQMVYTWNLPSGYSCPGALACQTFADRATGRITYGEARRKMDTFRCYSATGERYPAVRDVVWANFEVVKKGSAEEIAQVLAVCLPDGAERVRIHAGGDFFNQAYFDAYFDGWLLFCSSRPDVVFWAFTKSLTYWVARLERIPANLTLQASYGGRYDDLIVPHHLKYAKVVRSIDEAFGLGLEIDTDDTLAMTGSSPFALLEKSYTRKQHQLLMDFPAG